VAGNSCRPSPIHISVLGLARIRKNGKEARHDDKNTVVHQFQAKIYMWTLDSTPLVQL
jgi:hypothetical protein